MAEINVKLKKLLPRNKPLHKKSKSIILAGDFNMVKKLSDREGGNINNSHLICLNAINKL